MLGCQIACKMKPRTAADKFREELKVRIKWWATEFDLDMWSVVGVLFDAAVDALYGVDVTDDDGDDEDYDPTDEEDDED